MSSNAQLPSISDPGLPDSTGLRLLAVHAHPDDEASKGAAMMAAYVHAGARVMVATATDGSAGDLINPTYGESVRVDRDITAVRDRKSTRLNSSHVAISYAVFCLTKKID